MSESNESETKGRVQNCLMKDDVVVDIDPSAEDE